MTAEIEVPCHWCGKEAKTPSGINYIGKNIYDSGAKPCCPECAKKQYELSKIVQFKEESWGKVECQRCFSIIKISRMNDHAKFHNVDAVAKLV